MDDDDDDDDDDAGCVRACRHRAAPRVTIGILAMADDRDDARLLQLEEDTDSLCDVQPPGIFSCFLSYCDADSDWAQGLISKLESPERGFSVCHHERDFLAGKPIVDNMVDAIHRSHKILLVLSADYLSSRWCTWETHMSILGNTNIGKAIVPILMGPVDMPFQLKHLTCLDAADPNFLVKLDTVLRTPNSLVEMSATLPSPSRMLHNGMLLLVMRPREQHLEPWKVGTFNEYMIPPMLGWIVSLQDFMKAMLIINKMPKTASVFSEHEKREKCKRLLQLLIFAVIVAFIAVIMRFSENRLIFPVSISGLVLLLALLLGTMWYVWTWPRHEYRRQQARLHERVGEANRVFITSSIMAGCGPRGELLFVYMCVEQCRVLVCNMLNACLTLTPAETEELFVKALRLFSCAYVATCGEQGLRAEGCGRSRHQPRGGGHVLLRVRSARGARPSQDAPRTLFNPQEQSDGFQE
ncbi:uncharacterized protein LOC133342291 isoform X1 [Lethenteron reissneri]|uniref:uncharacterized protein LOC133342291 isoform X1 n=2 Tax=Lethenteron reissneri TaxID=7753 RepID=UPI002AB65B78|nr:uncharacterized protein LOC133342291 isoform X1 [Lethenteron reissneri]